jgi:integrase
VAALRNDGAAVATSVADYLEFLLYSGLRRQEAAQLRWDQIDLKDRALIIPDPKNKVPHVLPLSSPLVEILERRDAQRVNAFVFPGRGPAGYLVEPKRHIAKVVAASSVQFSLHDLRRTFITAAEALDVPPYAIKRLVNHKMANDVTAGYIISDLERLRAPMERVATFLQSALRGDAQGATVHHLARRSA